LKSEQLTVIGYIDDIFNYQTINAPNSPTESG